MKRTALCLAVGLTCAVPLAVLAQANPQPSQPAPPSAQPSTPSSAQMPHQHQPGMQHPPQAAAGHEQQIQYKGRVSDIWSTKLEKGKAEQKVVLIETDMGQTILANVGPKDQLKVELEEGIPAAVTGTMMYLEDEDARRFVPHRVDLGAQALAAPAERVPAKQVKAPQKQKVTGKVVAKENMAAKETKIDQQLVVLEVDPQTRILVDLGPAGRAEAMKLEEGDKVQVEGQAASINEHRLLTASKVQAKGREMVIQRSAAPIPTSVMPGATQGQPPSQAPAPPRQPVTP